MSYYEHTDHEYASNIGASVPEAFESFMAWNKQVLHNPDNAISPKHAELMALAVALTTQCPHCIEAHTKAAHAAGATEKEIAETTMIAAMLRAGGGYAHGLMAMKFYDQAQQTEQGASV